MHLPVSHSSRRRYVALAALAALPWIASFACVVYRPIVTRPPTLGDELIQLDAARRDGLLTQEEYDTRRAETIAAWKRIGDAPIVEAKKPEQGVPPTTTASPASK
jgi:hypothetical protein